MPAGAACLLCGGKPAVARTSAATHVELSRGLVEIESRSFWLCAGDELVTRATGLLPRYCPSCASWRRASLRCAVCRGELGEVDSWEPVQARVQVRRDF